MDARHLATAFLMLCLLAAAPAAGWESDFTSLKRASGLTPVSIDPANPEVVFELVGQIGLGAGNVQAVATDLTGQSPVDIPVTEVDSAGYPGGVSTYFSLDASPICDGNERILTATYVNGGLTQSAASRLVVCSP